MKKLLYIPLAILLAASCKQAPETPARRVVISGIDQTKKPGDDFFEFANGIWYDTAKIPASQTGVGSYSFLNYPQRLRLQAILDSISQATNMEEPSKKRWVTFTRPVRIPRHQQPWI